MLVDKVIREYVMSIQSIIQVNIEIMLAVLCVGIWILTRVWTKNDSHPFRYIWRVDILTVGLLVSDIFAILYRGNTTTTGYYVVRVANYFNFFFIYTITMYFTYLAVIVFEHPEKGTKRLKASRMISLFAHVMLLINIFVPIVYDFDEQNRYFRKAGWYVNSLGQLIVVIMLASVLWDLRKIVEPVVYWMLLVDVLMPIIATAFQLFIYGFAIVNIAVGITQILLFMILYRFQEEKLKEKEIQIGEYNAKLILTQVQPHFMLNTLSTIQYLCKHDSEAAAETINDFSVYLRNNMEFATKKDMIPFEKELAHIEKYVSIEKRRFGDRVNVVYDIKEKDFEIPPLSVQPLVENAIKHGISKKRGGGTVELSTSRGVNNVCIIVKDDGVGFDPEKPFSEDRVHLGLEIVNNRLKKMCDGTVQITSEVNKGTLCEITIPIAF